ncbi:MAG: DUF2905 domain-containing protein [Chloroflexi bacterium]|nr:DUF2905 domain-containing protein [Chloroflexota bacterium]
MEDLGKILVLFGVLIAVVGGAMVLIGKVPGIGRLPGDIVIQRDGFSCFFPIVTSIVLSIVLTLVLNVILRILNR